MLRTLRFFPSLLLIGWPLLPSSALADPIVFADPQLRRSQSRKTSKTPPHNYY
jgi:hypothetical protein